MSDKNDGGSSDEEDGKGKGGKSRRELPAGAVSTLKAWLLSPEHFTHPYPTPQDQVMLMQKTGIDKKQLKNWFTNARRRIWKPMLKKQLEHGKLTSTGAGGGVVAVPGVIPGLMMTGVHPGQEVAEVQYQTQPQQYDQYGNPVYMQQPPAPQPPAPAPQPTYSQQYYAPPQQQQQQPAYGQSPAPADIAQSSSVGSLPPITVPANVSAPTMNKTDSHAVLMELFARDQDLVRQATESAKMKQNAKASTNNSGVDTNPAQQQHPMKIASQSKLGSIPTLTSWPQFSSISSLNNLGTMTGVKSITSMSGADLASQGNLNKMGNLAQVKSMESMGKNDSYAFLEVFFGDRSMSSTNMAGKDTQRGIKREREEDNDVGLSLDADESPSTSASKAPMDHYPTRALGAPTPAPLPSAGSDPIGDSGTLKRAYDDALAARGLMSVSRSSEKLSDLAIPAKMRRTLSQEYLRQHQTQVHAVQSQQQTQQYGQYTYNASPAPASVPVTTVPVSQQYAGQHPGQHPGQQQVAGDHTYGHQDSLSSDHPSGEVHVPSTSICARCHTTGVDTQLRPCGHMFHERCLKPSLQVPVGQPKCPIDNTPIQSALLAVPTDETMQPPQQQPQQWNTTPSYAMPTEASSSKA